MTNQSDIKGSDTTVTISAGINITAGLFLAAAAIGALVWLVPHNTLPSGAEHDIQPRFFPSLAAWVVLVLSATLVGINCRRRSEVHTGLKGSTILLELAVWAVVGMVTMFALTKTGFLFVAPILICGGMMFARYRNWWAIGPLSILLPLLIDQAAWVFFTVDLP